MTYRPAKAKPRKRRRQDDLDQARFDLRPHSERMKEEGGRMNESELVHPSSFGLQPSESDLDREVEVHIEQTRREPLPGQTGLPWERKP